MTKINMSFGSLKNKVGAKNAKKLTKHQAPLHKKLNKERELNRYILSHPEMTPYEMRSLLRWVQSKGSPYRYITFWDEFNPEASKDYIEGMRKEQLINNIIFDLNDEEMEEFFTKNNKHILLEKLKEHEKNR